MSMTRQRDVSLWGLLSSSHICCGKRGCRRARDRESEVKAGFDAQNKRNYGTDT